jgi:hypothetical protein
MDPRLLFERKLAWLRENIKLLFLPADCGSIRVVEIEAQSAIDDQITETPYRVGDSSDNSNPCPQVGIFFVLLSIPKQRQLW